VKLYCQILEDSQITNISSDEKSESLNIYIFLWLLDLNPVGTFDAENLNQHRSVSFLCHVARYCEGSNCKDKHPLFFSIKCYWNNKDKAKNICFFT